MVMCRYGRYGGALVKHILNTSLVKVIGRYALSLEAGSDGECERIKGINESCGCRY